MTHSPHALAAIASAAVPGLDPVSVQVLTNRRSEWFQVALVGDARGRNWVVRVPLSAAAGAELDQTQSLTALLDRRLPYSLPVAQGHLPLGEAGRASVSPFIPGHPLHLASVPPGGRLAAQVGRALAALHNLDPRLYDEVAAPAYETETYRQRRESDLDRAARTGRVPTGLLARWEYALEETRLWRFDSCPVHGSLMGRNLLATFDGETAEEGKVTGVTGWEASRVADPADDFAWLVGQCSPETWRAVRDAYTEARGGRVDDYLDSRARLAAELHLMTSLLAAVTAEDEDLVDTFAEKLRYLDYDTSEEDVPLVPPRGGTPEPPAPSAALAEDAEVVAEPDPVPEESEPTRVGAHEDVVEQPEDAGPDVREPEDAGSGGDAPAPVSRTDPTEELWPPQRPGDEAADDRVSTATHEGDADPAPEAPGETDVTAEIADVGSAPAGPAPMAPAPGAAAPTTAAGDDAAFEVSPDPQGAGFVPVSRPADAPAAPDPESADLYDLHPREEP